jgi:hypothetical protein
MDQFSIFVKRPLLLSSKNLIVSLMLRLEKLPKMWIRLFHTLGEDHVWIGHALHHRSYSGSRKGISVMAGQLIELADSLGGTFYLPYRNFATPAQIQGATLVFLPSWLRKEK